MKVFRASTHVEDGILQLRLNNITITQNNDAYEQELNKGDYIVQWFTEGKAYTSFGITISSPGTAEFHLIRTFDASGKDYGGFRFSV